MSSTNRSSARDKHIADYYITPTVEIEKFLSAFLIDEKIDSPDELFTLDPCGGGDATHPMSYPTVLEKVGIYPHTIDIREDSLANRKGDFLQMNDLEKYDIIITNPPFNIALDIIKKSLAVVKDGGYVIMLLRLNFFGSKGRFNFWCDNMPKYAYVHHQRMSFTENGSTDSIEYMHCVWVKGENPLFTKLSII
jgi:hypothetical protein